jgi:hypothetical protein
VAVPTPVPCRLAAADKGTCHEEEKSNIELSSSVV